MTRTPTQPPNQSLNPSPPQSPTPTPAPTATPTPLPAQPPPAGPDGPPHRRAEGAAPGTASGTASVRVPYRGLLDFVARVLGRRRLPEQVAGAAAEALCHGDLAGFPSHGVANLVGLYLPLLDSGRCVPDARPVPVADRGAAVLLDAGRALGLWAASEAMDLAIARARDHGIGLVSVRGGTHFGCAGYHAARAARQGMVGLVTANCGRQRIVPPIGGRIPMLGTNPLSLAAPAGDPAAPFVLDMSTTVVPTGRIRCARREGRSVPAGWLEDEQGRPVTDPTAFAAGEARLRWLGGDPETGGYKGYGLALLVEVLSALLPGSAFGPRREGAEAAGASGSAEAGGAGGAGGAAEDEDIGYLTLAIAPGRLRPEAGFLADCREMFAGLLSCPPIDPDRPVSYPGLPEAERAAERRRSGVPLASVVHRELLDLARAEGLAFPDPVGAAR